MKKLLFFPTAILLFLLSTGTYGDTITLNQALESKMISLSITGADKNENTSSNTPSYTGSCIQMKIKNLTNKKINVYLEAGRFMQPDDSTVQRMIVTKEQMIALEKNATKRPKIFAMCSKMMNRAPDTSTAFSLGKKAEGKLLELAQLISKKNFQDNAAQSAIWAMTDNNDFSDIYADNKEEMKILRNFVREAKGIKDDPAVQSNAVFDLKKEAEGTYLKYTKGNINGSFEFELKQDLQLSMNLYNENGELKRMCMQNYTFKSGVNTVTYKFEYFNVPLGNYHLKLIDNKGNVFIDKILTFK